MKFFFVEAFYDEEIKLSKESLKILSGKKTVALFASVQFVKLDKVKGQLKDEGINVIGSKAKRTSTGNQILGCDCYSSSFEDKEVFNKADIVLYIGDGLFHPKALLLAQKDNKTKKEVLIFDPISKTSSILTQKDIEKQNKKYNANLVRYMYAKNVGLLVSTKTGQQYLKSALSLKENSKDKDKTFYLFVGDTLDMREMENFPFIDAWVNTACPRIGFDDIVNFKQPMININDAFKIESDRKSALKSLEKN